MDDPSAHLTDRQICAYLAEALMSGEEKARIRWFEEILKHIGNCSVCTQKLEKARQKLSVQPREHSSAADDPNYPTQLAELVEIEGSSWPSHRVGTNSVARRN